MEPATFRFLQKNSTPEEKEFVNSFKDRKLEPLENLRHNVPYQVAVCLLYYSSFDVHKKDLSSKKERARLYKKFWNTPAGKATPAFYLKRAKKHLGPYYVASI